MNRRAFFTVFAGLMAAPVAGLGAKPVRKWYITGGLREVDDKLVSMDCTVPPIIAYGVDRFDAVCHDGQTVWSEEEWADFQRETGPLFRAFCAAAGKGTQ
jgi:hypothetical protein